MLDNHRSCRDLTRISRSVKRRAIFIVVATGWLATNPLSAVPIHAQAPPPGYPPQTAAPPPPPPCSAVTGTPLRGAARGAAGGAAIGAIAGDAGKGAAIGSAVGGVGNAVRRGSARPFRRLLLKDRSCSKMTTRAERRTTHEDNTHGDPHRRGHRRLRSANWRSAGWRAVVANDAPPAGMPRASTPSDAQVGPRKWEVARVRCSDLLNASDDDRASATMFYYGYLAATAGTHVIDVEKISENIEKVMKQCEAQSSLTAPEAFRKAIASRK
jgi:HdeA/HdeB family/Glycine-zipper domain